MSNGTCSVDDCNRPHYGRSWCVLHYSRWLRHGDPLFVKFIRNGHEERFLTYVDRREDDVCWPWKGYVARDGYGLFTVSGRLVGAHRWAYAHFVAPVPQGWHVDHVRANGCVRRDCVNWRRHLEAVTPRENLMRGDTHAARNAAKTHCIRGHEFTPENTYAQHGGRGCRKCKNAGKRAKRQGVTLEEALGEVTTS